VKWWIRKLLRFSCGQYIGDVNNSSCRTPIDVIPKRGESSRSEL